jgi:hypothetical protein
MYFKQTIQAIFLVVFLSSQTYAALVVDREFSFGKIAITKNDSVSSLQMLRNGKATTDGSIYILEIGQPGVYTLTDLPPLAIVSLSAQLPAFSNAYIVGTQQLTLSAVDMADNVRADASGTVQFKIGGVLQTSGLGGKYIGPATYPILLDIEINY